MRSFPIAICLIALISSMVQADIPDPSNCACTLDDVGRVLLCPGGDVGGEWQVCMASIFAVEVRNAANAPIDNAEVVVSIGGQAGGYTGLCSSAILVQHSLPNGIAIFGIPGGGCYKHQPDACVITANGTLIRQYTAVMSPDYAGWDDDGIPARWSLTVTPTDLAAFVSAYSGGTGPASCHDYDNDGTTGPTDLSVFTQSYFGGTGYCP